MSALPEKAERGWADATERLSVGAANALEARDKFVKLAAELVRMSYFEDGKRAAENVRNDMRDLGVRIRQAADAMYARSVPGERGRR